MKFFRGIIFFALLSLRCFSQDSSATRYASYIKADDLSSYLHVLASDSLEGRETGKEGQKKAATFIAGHFALNGLNPVSHGTYLQHHPITAISNRGKNIEINQQYFLFDKDYFFISGLKDTLIILDSISFVGYGISGTDYDDYRNMNVAGKAILFFDGSPGNKKKKRLSGVFDWTNKVNAINKQGPAIVFIICDSIDRVIDSLNHNNPQAKTIQSPRVASAAPVIFITYEMAKAFFPERDENMLDKAKSYIDRKNKPRNFVLSTSAFVHLVNNTSSLEGDNVIGYIEGTDKKDETIIISAHYDHLGKKDSVIYHGADDDGSGTAAVMELAKIFMIAKKEGHGPHRSLLFIAFSGEEGGLLGSSYYVTHPLIPLDKTVADLNSDMIGRTDEVHDSLGVRDYVYVIGSDKLSTELHKISERANAMFTKLQLDYKFNEPGDPNRFYYRSDHFNFARNKIPIIFYFNGAHHDYHTPGDTVDKIDFELLAKRTRLVFFTAWELANREQRIKVDVKNNMERGEE